MPTSAARTITINYAGDVQGIQTFTPPEGVNTNAAGPDIPIALLAGDNTINVPAGGPAFEAVTIVKPIGQNVLIKLKMVDGDAGLPLHKQNPDSISLDSSVTSFVLTADNPAVVHLFWS